MGLCMLNRPQPFRAIFEALDKNGAHAIAQVLRGHRVIEVSMAKGESLLRALGTMAEITEVPSRTFYRVYEVKSKE